VDRGYSRVGASNPMAFGQLRLFTVLEMAYGNPFEDARVQNVEVDFDLRFERDTVQIIDASVAAREVDPGSTVPVRIVLRRFGHPEEVRIVRVRVPERVAGETITIQIEGGGGVNIETLSPRNLDELLSIVHQRYPQTSMVVSVDMPTRGLRFGGHIVRDLPRSALDSLQLRNDSDRNRPFITHDRQEIPLGDVVSGSASVEVSVRRTPRP
jgi:hypothetical protein